jgi:hypothetical protein
MVSKGLSDEVYVIRDLDIIIRIHEIIDYLSSESAELQVFSVLTVSLLKLTRSDIIISNTISNMENDRRDQPILITDLYGEERIIDGHHRLQKRHSDGFHYCHIIYISKDLIVRFSSPYSDFRSSRRHSKWRRELFGEKYA